MLSRLKILLFVPLFILGGIAVRAQDSKPLKPLSNSKDYLQHGKTFCLCSFKLECSYCHECNNERYAVKINNNANKKITGVFYAYYSEPLNRVVEKEGKIEVNEIAGLETGIVHICVPNGRHWIISRIMYNDNTAEAFVLHERMDKFHQDADECDCND